MHRLRSHLITHKYYTVGGYRLYISVYFFYTDLIKMKIYIRAYTYTYTHISNIIYYCEHMCACENTKHNPLFLRNIFQSYSCKGSQQYPVYTIYIIYVYNPNCQITFFSPSLNNILFLWNRSPIQSYTMTQCNHYLKLFGISYNNV